MPDSAPENNTLFTSDAQGNSLGLPKVIIDSIQAAKRSTIRSRGGEKFAVPPSSITVDGVPGVPFEEGTPNPDVFYQGEDVIFDAYLYFDGAEVDPDKFDVNVIVKTSPRSFNVVWNGTLGNGVYATENPGYFEIWIKASDISAIRAGSYYLEIQLKEKEGQEAGRFPRTRTAIQHVFNIDYNVFSQRPEAANGNPNVLRRENIESTWPNTPNTIGR